MKNIPKALLLKPEWRERKTRRREERRGEAARAAAHACSGAMTHGACSGLCSQRPRTRDRQKALGQHTVRESLTRLPLLAGVQDGERFNRERTPRYILIGQAPGPLNQHITYRHVYNTIV